MSSALQYCVRHNLIKPPTFCVSGLIYETLMGSESYGCSKGGSDTDIYAICIPSRNIIFPHTAGYLDIFDNDRPKFEQYQQHDVNCESSGKKFDFSVFNITQFFAHLMRGVPNCIDALFTKDECVKHITQAGIIVRDNRKMFLSKECWKTFRGYSASQMKHLEHKNPTGKRKEVVDKYGYDLKFAYQALRLLSEAEQIITTGDLDLMQGAEEFKAIRRGDWTLQQFNERFNARMVALEEVFHKCTLPEKPDKNKVREVLLGAIECHYGRSLTEADVVKTDLELGVLRDIEKAMGRIRHIL